MNMVERTELEKKIRHIHDQLLLVNNPPNYGREAVEEWAGFKREHKGNPNFHFILNICYGPWREERQKKVWMETYPKFEELGGNILNINELSKVFLAFPLPWQFNHVFKLSKYLQQHSITFSQLIESWEPLTGLEIRDNLKKIIKANTTKVFSTFIRDYLEKSDIFPIDRRVESMLNKLGLPNNEDLMVLLCQDAGIVPSKIEKILYEFPESYCTLRKFNDCPIRDDCFCYLLKGECC